MQTSISDVKTWMTQNKLKLNDDETEAVLMKSNRTISFCSDAQLTSLRVGTADIPFPTCACNLVFVTSDKMTLLMHISTVCRSSYEDIRRASSVHQYLTVEVTRISSAVLFSPSWTIVILFYLAVHFTFSVDYKKFRTLQRNWFSKRTNVIICSLF